MTEPATTGEGQVAISDLQERVARAISPDPTPSRRFGVDEQARRAIAAIQQAERERIATLKAEYAAIKKRDHERYHSEPPPKRIPPGYYGCVGCWACGGSFETWAGKKLHDHVLGTAA